MVEVLAWLGLSMWCSRFAWVCGSLVSDVGRSRAVDRPLRSRVRRTTDSAHVADAPTAPRPPSVDLVRHYFGPHVTATLPGQVPYDGDLVVVTRPVRLSEVAARRDAPVLVLRPR